MAKKKFKNVCGCGAGFATGRGLSLHKTALEHWVYPKPAPAPAPEPTRFYQYADIANGNWGVRLTEKSRRSPDDATLVIGTLFRILHCLERVEKELKREKVLK